MADEAPTKSIGAKLHDEFVVLYTRYAEELRPLWLSFVLEYKSLLKYLLDSVPIEEIPPESSGYLDHKNNAEHKLYNLNNCIEDYLKQWSYGAKNPEWHTFFNDDNKTFNAVRIFRNQIITKYDEKNERFQLLAMKHSIFIGELKIINPINTNKLTMINIEEFRKMNAIFVFHTEYYGDEIYVSDNITELMCIITGDASGTENLSFKVDFSDVLTFSYEHLDPDYGKPIVANESHGKNVMTDVPESSSPPSSSSSSSSPSSSSPSSSSPSSSSSSSSLSIDDLNFHNASTINTLQLLSVEYAQAAEQLILYQSLMGQPGEPKHMEDEPDSE